jgi:hypothetical protein
LDNRKGEPVCGKKFPAIRNRVRRHRAGAMVDAASKKAPASLYRGFK